MSDLISFKLLQNDSETFNILSQPPLISFKCNKNIGNFSVRSSFQTNDQPGIFKCARSRCKTCPFIHNVGKISGPKRSIKTSYVHPSQCHLLHNLHSLQKVIHQVTDSENTFATQKEMTRTHPNQSQYTSVSLIILNSTWQFAVFPYIQAFRKATKLQNKNLSSKSAFLILMVSTSASAFHSINLFLFSRHHILTNSVAPFSAYEPTQNPQFLQSL